MTYEDRDTYGMYKNYDEKGPGPQLMGADTLIGDDVYNHKDEDLGDIKEIMLDVNSGKIAYAVLSFGGFLGIADKLVRRHPHVFERGEGEDALTSGQVIEKWETLKARERAAAGAPAKTKTTLSGVPKTLPALLRAYEVSFRAAAVGFDWARPDDVLDKIEEEVEEVRREVESGATGNLSRAEEEMGDLLFAIANLSRKLGIEPEAALRRATDKFTNRFESMERAFATRGKRLSESSLEEMEAEWQAVKKNKP